MHGEPLGKSYELFRAVEPDDIDALGHVNNAVFVRWVQDVAVAHWQRIAPPHVQAEVLWVVVRHEINYKQPALPDDVVLLRTWVGAAEGLRFERHTQVLRATDRGILAEARTLWVPIDPQTKRPKRVSAELRGLLSQ